MVDFVCIVIFNKVSIELQEIIYKLFFEERRRVLCTVMSLFVYSLFWFVVLQCLKKLCFWH